MTIANALARPLLAGIFVYGGIDAMRHPPKKVDSAGGGVLETISDATGLDEQRLVIINGAVQVGAGIALALGFLPRPAAAVLGASLVPTTLAGHRFWEHEGDARKLHTTQFLKNLAMLGGLIVAATTTGGRPSVPWLTKRAAHHLAEATGDAVSHLRPG